MGETKGPKICYGALEVRTTRCRRAVEQAEAEGAWEQQASVDPKFMDQVG
jgi:hypothetical protein